MDEQEIYYHGKVNQLLSVLCDNLSDCLCLIDDEDGILSAEDLELMGRLSDILEDTIDRMDRKHKMLADENE